MTMGPPLAVSRGLGMSDSLVIRGAALVGAAWAIFCLGMILFPRNATAENVFGLSSIAADSAGMMLAVKALGRRARVPGR